MHEGRPRTGSHSHLSATKGSTFGNIVIGAIIDHDNGAAYEYPPFVQVTMGMFSKQAAPKPAAAPESDNACSKP